MVTALQKSKSETTQAIKTNFWLPFSSKKNFSIVKTKLFHLPSHIQIEFLFIAFNDESKYF